MWKGITRQLININPAMLEMLSGRAVGAGATMGGVAVEARSAVEARGGGGGVAE